MKTGQDIATFHQFTVRDALGNLFPLASLKGKVVLVVNVASHCGFTYQYKALESLFREFKSAGFVVIAFPCNQFGNQEPGNEAEIVDFCQTKFEVSFPIMAKIDVNGANADPLFHFLKTKAPGILGSEMIKWNFTKFLISREGDVIARYAPAREPEELRLDIERALVPHPIPIMESF